MAAAALGPARPLATVLPVVVTVKLGVDGSVLRHVRAPVSDQLARTARLLTGALVATRTICGYCATGCSLDVHLADGAAVNLTPTAGHRVNLGMACPKGWEALAPLAADDRATTPLARRDRNDPLEPVSWTEALQTLVDGVTGVQARYGREAMAFLSTGQIPTEEVALLGALTKFGMGMVHGDGNTRQCMATAVTAYKEALGFDAPPYTCADVEQSDVIVLVGSNLAIAHPIMWERLARNPHDPEIVVVDTRRTETAPAPTRPPASATRWARGCLPTPPTCSAATTSPTPTTGPRSPPRSTSTPISSRIAAPGPTTRSWTASPAATSAGCG